MENGGWGGIEDEGRRFYEMTMRTNFRQSQSQSAISAMCNRNLLSHANTHPSHPYESYPQLKTYIESILSFRLVLIMFSTYFSLRCWQVDLAEG